VIVGIGAVVRESNTGKNAAGQSEHPDQAPAFTSTVRTFSVD